MRKTYLKIPNSHSSENHHTDSTQDPVSMSQRIISLDEALGLIKGGYREKVKKLWEDFVDKNNDEFNENQPTENQFISYFKDLREEKSLSSSSIWTYYSSLNCVMKNRYGTPLQKYPRITTLLKSYNGDVKKKAAIFESSDIEEFVKHPNKSPYWLVRKVKPFFIV